MFWKIMVFYIFRPVAGAGMSLSDAPLMIDGEGERPSGHDVVISPLLHDFWANRFQGLQDFLLKPSVHVGSEHVPPSANFPLSNESCEPDCVVFGSLGHIRSGKVRNTLGSAKSGR